MSRFNANPELTGMAKNATQQQLTKMQAVLSAHIGMDSSVQVTLTLVLKELNGLVTTVKQFNRDVNQECTGLVVHVLLFPHNVQPN